MQGSKLAGLVALSVVTISINGLPLVPIGFLIAAGVVVRPEGGGGLWEGIVDGWRQLLACVAGLVAGLVLLQAGCNVQARQDGFGCGMALRTLPVRDWLPASERERMLAAYNRGQALKDRGRCAEALEPFRRAAEMAPDEPDPHLQLCTCHLLQLDQPEQAAVACRRAHELAPDHPEPMYKLALAHMMQDDYASADRWARRVLEADPDRLDALNVLAMSQAEQDQPGALESAATLVERAPENSLYRSNFAMVLAHFGRCAAARDQLDRARALGAEIGAPQKQRISDCREQDSETGE